MKRTFALSHFRTLALLFLVVGCEREKRSFRETPPGATAFPAVQTSELQAGPKTTDPSAGAYQENRFAISQGQTFYVQYNCAGCHSPGGGGGMGPPLNDGEWIYGSDPENVFQTIVQGRPNGMPAFRGRIDNAQVWMLVAYVRTMGGLTPPDAWPARADHMQETRPAIDAQPQRQLP
ncbi:MAG TPA: c-type cytochrome [Longimicrobium sp.]|nr:c-type cytochrome [Longimicrobium sp.]